MPHQCVKCSRIIPTGSRELLEGCLECKSHFFFYIKEDHFEKIKEQLVEIPIEEKKQVEKDIRKMAGIIDENTPVILEFESIKVSGEGKFELDVVKLFKKGMPLVYKLEEGKYVIDLSSTFKNKSESSEKK